MGWREEFERRALAASGAPPGSRFDEITTDSENWAYSEYTAGTDTWFEVSWLLPDAPGTGSKRWDTMAELLAAMDRVK